MAAHPLGGHARFLPQAVRAWEPIRRIIIKYEIRVRGQLGETIRTAFPALQARSDGRDTVLTGALADRAAVFGVLAEVEALGLELIEVRRLPPDEPEKPPS
jgi:hypothetical protein